MPGMNLKIAYLMLKSELQEIWHTRDHPFTPVKSDLYNSPTRAQRDIEAQERAERLKADLEKLENNG
jgi:hypothetical protein